MSREHAAFSGVDSGFEIKNTDKWSKDWPVEVLYAQGYSAVRNFKLKTLRSMYCKDCLEKENV